MKLRFDGERITASIDNTQLAQVNDKTHGKGRAGVGTGWNHARFDNFDVSPVASTSAPNKKGTPDETYDPEKRGAVNGIAS